jgi:hypothetical protein
MLPWGDKNNITNRYRGKFPVGEKKPFSTLAQSYLVMVVKMELGEIFTARKINRVSISIDLGADGCREWLIDGPISLILISICVFLHDICIFLQ